MTQEQIIEGNTLIAQFMGNSVNIHGETLDWEKRQSTVMRYHSSWDWLMPVISKIIRLGDKDDDAFMEYRKSSIDAALRLILLERAWEHVVAYINWYNRNKK